MEIFLSLLIAIGILIGSSFFSGYKNSQKDSEIKQLKTELKQKNLKLAQKTKKSEDITRELKEANEVIVHLYDLSAKDKKAKGKALSDLTKGKKEKSTPQVETRKTATRLAEKQPLLKEQNKEFSVNFPEKRAGIYYAIKVGDFTDLKEADLLALRLKKKGYSIRVIYRKRSASPFIILIGKYNSKEDANKIAKVFESKESMKAYIITTQGNDMPK